MRAAIIDQFRSRMGYKPDLDNPKTINEWIAVWKLEDDPRLKHYTDKITAKDTINGIVEATPTIYAGDINWKPKSYPFIAKPSDRSGETVIISDNRDWIRFKARFLSLPPYWRKNYETNYRGISKRVLIEPILQGMIDVKVTCIHGEPKFMEIYSPRKNAPVNAPQKEGSSFFDTDGRFMDVKNVRHPIGLKTLPGIDLDNILEAARKLSEPFKFVRIDLLINENIYFGEYSFWVGGGYTKYNPPDFAQTIGSWITK